MVTAELFRRVLLIGAAGVAAAALGVIVLIAAAVQGLPDYTQLKEYRPPVTTRVYAGDGGLIAEFAEEQRVFVPSQEIPDIVKQAFISAEDKSFYEHSGLDYWGLFRATVTNIASIFTGDRLQGASTITQQVAKNMLLSSDRTLMRKVKEAFLAQRIEKSFDKEKILELYLNEIFLGNHAYGVSAAAQNYFNKSLDELTVQEAAYLAALPKGPNNYDPVKRKERAVARRNYVLTRMAENGYISQKAAEEAKAAPLEVTNRLEGDIYRASTHFVEQVRREANARMGGEKAVKTGGFTIRSSLNQDLQLAAARALRKGLEGYDRRHEWRGPIGQVSVEGDPAAALSSVPSPPPLTGWSRAVVTEAGRNSVKIALEDGSANSLVAADVKWAASAARKDKSLALTEGSAIYVECAAKACNLRQEPEVEGAIVALNPHTGRVLAMVGGYDFKLGTFDRAVDAKRQPGSAFKPVVYAAAMDPCTYPDQKGCGLTPATLVDDAPFALPSGDGTVWSPDNYTETFGGATTMRVGLEKSINTITGRLVMEMGPERAFDYATRLGLYNPDQRNLAVYAIGLGVGETSLLRMTTAYGMFVNGGREISPTFIDRVQDRDGRTVMSADTRPCQDCNGPYQSATPPRLPDTREQLLDPITAYQVVSMMQGVVERGTGASVKAVGKTLAGKTGTTNDYKDAWFVGFSPDLVVGVWVGFDKPKSLGRGETGGSLAAPIFRDFMKEALKDVPDTPFRIPPGVRLVRVDAKQGTLPTLATENTIVEAFRPGTEPTPFDDITSTVIIGREQTGFPGLPPPDLTNLPAIGGPETVSSDVPGGID